MTIQHQSTIALNQIIQANDDVVIQGKSKS